MTGAAAALVLMFAQPVLADGSFANGTSVNGVAVGGMSNEEAKAKLEQNYGSYKLTIKERGGKTEEITAAEIGYKVVITNELQAAIDQQAAGAAGGRSADDRNAAFLRSDDACKPHCFLKLYVR